MWFMVRMSDMIPEDVQEKLDFFNKDKYAIAAEKIDLKERKKYGEVCLTCRLNKDTLIFMTPENNTLPYLDEKIKYARACPDKFLFELDTDDKWILHVMEFKKTINTASIGKSKRQFVMGIYNARALAGFLNIQIKEIYIYSVYRNDKIESMDDTLIQIRSMNMDPEALKIIREWKKGKCSLNLDSKKSVFAHGKIQLDQDGKGEGVLI